MPAKDDAVVSLSPDPLPLITPLPGTLLLQRRFITERLESARAKLDDYLVQETSGAEKRRLMEEVLTWAREFGQGLDEVTPEERHDYLQMIVEEVIIDRDNNVDITLALPIDDDSSDPESPDPECVSIGSQESSP